MRLQFDSVRYFNKVFVDKTYVYNFSGFITAAKPAPDISYVQPNIIHNINRAEKLEHFCHFLVKPGDRSFHYTVEWSLSDGSSLARQLSIGTATKDDEKTFNDTTKLTEADLAFNGILKLGYTVTD